MSCLPPPPAELTFCDPAKPGTLPSAGFPGLPDMGVQNCKSRQPARPHLTDSSSFFIANSFVTKNKAFVQEYRDRGWEILARGRWIP